MLGGGGWGSRPLPRNGVSPAISPPPPTPQTAPEPPQNEVGSEGAPRAQGGDYGDVEGTKGDTEGTWTALGRGDTGGTQRGYGGPWGGDRGGTKGTWWGEGGGMEGTWGTRRGQRGTRRGCGEHRGDVDNPGVGTEGGHRRNKRGHGRAPEWRWGAEGRKRGGSRGGGRGEEAGGPRAHLRTNLEVNLLKRLADGPRRPWLAPEGEAGGTA